MIDLKTALENVVGGQFISLEILTEPKLNKGRGKNKNPLFGKVSKYQKIQGRIQQYASVKAKELGISKDEVEVETPSWSEHVDKNPFLVRHKFNGQVYFAIKPEKRLSVTYLVDGRPATDKEIEDIKNFSPKKSEGPPWMMVKEQNILSLSINKKVFK